MKHIRQKLFLWNIFKIFSTFFSLYLCFDTSSWPERAPNFLCYTSWFVLNSILCERSNEQMYTKNICTCNLQYFILYCYNMQLNAFTSEVVIVVVVMFFLLLLILFFSLPIFVLSEVIVRNTMKNKTLETTISTL